MNFKDLKRIIKECILEKVDHKNLNVDVPFMKDKITSCENLVISFWEILQPEIAAVSNNRAALHTLKLFETSTSYAEYSGERLS